MSTTSTASNKSLNPSRATKDTSTSDHPNGDSILAATAHFDDSPQAGLNPDNFPDSVTIWHLLHNETDDNVKKRFETFKDHIHKYEKIVTRKVRREQIRGELEYWDSTDPTVTEHPPVAEPGKTKGDLERLDELARNLDVLVHCSLIARVQDGFITGKQIVEWHNAIQELGKKTAFRKETRERFHESLNNMHDQLVLVLAEPIIMLDHKEADDKDSVAGADSDHAPKSIIPSIVVSTAVDTIAGRKASTNNEAGELNDLDGVPDLHSLSISASGKDTKSQATSQALSGTASSAPAA